MKLTELHETPIIPQNQNMGQISATMPAVKSEDPIHENWVQEVLRPTDWLSAKLYIQAEEDSSALEIGMEHLNQAHLLQALQNAETNLQGAQTFVKEVEDLLATLKSEYGIAPNQATRLKIETSQAPLWIDPQALNPERLMETFVQARSLLDLSSLQTNHQALAPLAATVLEQMRSTLPNVQQAEAWLESLNNPDFPSSWIQALQKGLQAQKNQRASSLQGLEENPGQDSPAAPAWGLSAEAEALIQLANALEENLELAPTPNSPDVLELFRAFAKIFENLDFALNQLILAQEAKLKEKKNLLADFSETLWQNQKYSQAKLDQLHLQVHERFRIGLEALLNPLKTKAEYLQTLLSEAADSPHRKEIKKLIQLLSPWISLPA
ncbi:hypothetical protein COW36_19885 [bacterium (Candidatus Blackallbacteria) CG17_big_fil_post_rev_8_21_14_2_50_48_46]|uniref:Uncharacterized protein n=1 Tax=bacterium (Candidatus Blackallbacteria) CG17_big_fil_post_rev_8_21_14_2_50_48_46 TaxID=2014261 RepID=A0A2M7G0X7_9BACT|nr:MAG: hypothetical protein COW64_15410 [bacterium (Candidatus Blackallbacteria) CG18_big_fil_WC_8_21_14_2_50_49_26]PIW14910.1 MAG: hypothetical protein COW36_19885 [bacterium (Candidatus Blackallbacteria) CG17_big_fil_post_rev_8_21_14_2_50_48_46]PIW44302.1 MAG: hypothetical protein COW20_24475 [bacterium (Candidatus Blackallbacteria) CG13_big_fil_rev_8_21_14_2_50_49_14]